MKLNAKDVGLNILGDTTAQGRAAIQQALSAPMGKIGALQGSVANFGSGRLGSLVSGGAGGLSGILSSMPGMSAITSQLNSIQSAMSSLQGLSGLQNLANLGNIASLANISTLASMAGAGNLMSAIGDLKSAAMQITDINLQSAALSILRNSSIMS